MLNTKKNTYKRLYHRGRVVAVIRKPKRKKGGKNVKKAALDTKRISEFYNLDGNGNFCSTSYLSALFG